MRRIELGISFNTNIAMQQAWKEIEAGHKVWIETDERGSHWLVSKGPETLGVGVHDEIKSTSALR